MSLIYPVVETTDGNKEGNNFLHLLGVQVNQVHDSNESLQSMITTCIPCKVGKIECENPLTTKQKFCQKCLFKGCGRKLLNVAYCKKHCIHACIQKYPDNTKTGLYYDTNLGKKVVCSDWSWMCPNKGMSCWDKFHTYYALTDVFYIHAGSKDKEKVKVVHVKHNSTINKECILSLTEGASSNDGTESCDCTEIENENMFQQQY